MQTTDLQSPELTGLCRDVENFTKSRVSPPGQDVIFKDSCFCAPWCWKQCSGPDVSSDVWLKYLEAQVRKSAALNSNLISTICTDANRTTAAAAMNPGVFRQWKKKTQVKLALRNRGRARRDGKHCVSDSVIRPASISHVSRRYWHWLSQSSKVFMLSCFDRKSPSHSVPLLSHHDKL